MRLYVLLMIYLAISLVASDSLSLGHSNYDKTKVETISRFLTQSGAGNTGCKARPSLCRLRGSPGLDCCQNTCVNILSDGQNCGRCGHKCKYPAVCCGGQCVDLLHNSKHCGRCYNKCMKDVSCSYGMCNYA